MPMQLPSRMPEARSRACAAGRAREVVRSRDPLVDGGDDVLHRVATCRRTAACRSPTAAMSSTTKPGHGGEPLDRVEPDGCPVEHRGDPPGDAQTPAVRTTSVPAASSSTTTRPPAARSGGADAAGVRVAADADVAVGQQRAVPASFTGHRREDVTPDGERAALASLPDASWEMSMPRAGTPSTASPATRRPGPQPDVDGAAAAARRAAVPGRWRRRRRSIAAAPSAANIPAWSTSWHERPANAASMACAGR